MTKKMKRVLIVDEDTTFLKMWEKVFQLMKNCHYSLSNDPEIAVTMAKERPVDLLISEVVMNKSNGFELAERIQKSNPNAEIILTTTYDCNLTHFNLNSPHFHILYKPYEKIDNVITMIIDVLQHKNPKDTADEDSWSENENFPSVMEWKL